MDCEDPKQRKQSKQKFKRVKTYSDFLRLWSDFYANKICIPTYYGTFVGEEDNPLATEQTSQKFQEITNHGVIPDDFQHNIHGNQKGYITAFIPSEFARIIAIYINRYPGFVTFTQDIYEGGVDNLYVTYDADQKILDDSAKIGVFLGDPFTHVGYAGEDDFQTIREWLSSSFKKRVFNTKNLRQITIIDTQPTAESERVVDMLLNALNDNRELTYRTINMLNSL